MHNLNEIDNAENLARDYFAARSLTASSDWEDWAVGIARDETYSLTGIWRVPAIRWFPNGDANDFRKNCELGLKGIVSLRFMQVGGKGQPENRVWQPKGSAPIFFWPRHGKARAAYEAINKATVYDRPTYAWTEGFAKVLALNKAGYIAASGQGVWGFADRKNGQLVLDKIKAFADEAKREGEGDWIPEKQRYRPRLEGVFDFDMGQKPSVKAACFATFREFIELGFDVYLVILPGPEKGVDDYLAAHGAAAYKELRRERFITLDFLDRYDREWAIIEEPPCVLRLDTGSLHKLGDIRSIMLHDRVLVTGRNGRQLERVAFDVWREHKLHTRYGAKDYVPGGPRDLPDRKYNGWKSWGVEAIEPGEGDLALYYALRDHLFTDSVMRHWVEQWLAHMIQRPTEKVMTALVMRGGQGVGKSLYAEILVDDCGRPEHIIRRQCGGQRQIHR